MSSRRHLVGAVMELCRWSCCAWALDTSACSSCASIVWDAAGLRCASPVARDTCRAMASLPGVGSRLSRGCLLEAVSPSLSSPLRPPASPSLNPGPDARMRSCSGFGLLAGLLPGLLTSSADKAWVSKESSRFGRGRLWAACSSSVSNTSVLPAVAWEEWG